MSKSNYHIAVIAPSGKLVVQENLQKNISYLRDLGHVITVGKHISNAHGPFAGTDNERLSDLQWAMDNPDIDLVWMARGGYGMTRIIDELNLEGFKSKPKMVIGFSDITALFLDPRIIDNACCHAPMLAFAEKEDIDRVLELLADGNQEYTCDVEDSFEIETTIRGGNLSLLAHQAAILGPDYFKSSAILIEELSEYDYKVDRMIWQLKRVGVFKACDAVFLGHFTDIESGSSPIVDFMENCIKLISKETRVISGLEIGHDLPNLPIILNKKCRIKAQNNSLRISYNS